MKLWLKLLLCIVCVNLLGAAGAIFTSASIGDWYATLDKPPGTPPNAVFGPVWALLYAMIGASLALVWHRAPAGSEKRLALTLFFVQMLVNLAWTPLFFGARMTGMALIAIVLLWVAILVTILKFRSLDRTAAALLVPYLLWVGYASYLNAAFFLLNRGG
jgi:tryptophan-rich sensory protein